MWRWAATPPAQLKGPISRSPDCFRKIEIRPSSLQPPNLPNRKKVGGTRVPPTQGNDDYGPVPMIVGIAGATTTTPVTPSGLQFEGSSCVAGWPAERNAPGPSRSYSTQAWSKRPPFGPLELKKLRLAQPTPNAGSDPANDVMLRR